MKAFLVLIGIIAFIILLGSSGGNNGSSYSSGRYDEYYDDESNDASYQITSDNWECTEDCSGHEAGYEWASDNGISDPYDCGGNSDSFIEGCEAYANEQRMEDEYEEEYYEEDDYRY